jgi:hypothetical protein
MLPVSLFALAVTFHEIMLLEFPCTLSELYALQKDQFYFASGRTNPQHNITGRAAISFRSCVQTRTLKLLRQQIRTKPYKCMATFQMAVTNRLMVLLLFLAVG